MKKVLTYNEFAERIDEVITKLSFECDLEDIQLVPVVRGGLTCAHRMAWKLKKPLTCFYAPGGGKFLGDLDRTKTVIFVEDLVAKGRTLAEVSKYMRASTSPWLFVPLVIDVSFQGILPKVYGRIEEDWIVFPYEDEQQVVEKDWGLFRDGTSENSK